MQQLFLDLVLTLDPLPLASPLPLETPLPPPLVLPLEADPFWLLEDNAMRIVNLKLNTT